jgi:putative serine protease PepD
MGHAGDEHDEESLGDIPQGSGRDVPRSALPDPLDRLWMHPSELSPLVGASAGPPTRARPMWSATLLAGAAGAILTLGVLSAVGAIGGSSDSTGETEAVPTSAAVASAPTVVIAVGRSVVAVSVSDKAGTRRGSGVVVRRANEILTSSRLVGSLAKKVTVTASDGVARTAGVVGHDKTTDLVLLRLDSRLLAATSTPRVPRQGEDVWIVSAARPGAKSPWVSKGALSSSDSLVSFAEGPTTSGLLETAAVSGTASSGGALVDTAGHVAGIVLSPVGESRTTYAVPIATALSVAEDLHAYGYAKHGTLGIDLVDAPAGPTVTALVAGGPAERVGVRVGDVVEAVDNQKVESMLDVMALVRHDSPGEPIVVELRRGSRTLVMTPTLTSTLPG